MVRLIPQPGTPVDPDSLHTLDDIAQARIDGRISRRDLMRRAAAIGITAPVVGVMLHMTSDSAFGAPSGGRDRALQGRNADQPTPVEGPTAPEGTPKEGGTIICGTNEEPDTLHPYLTQLVTGTDVWVGICEGLLKYDSNQALQPALATEYTVSDDGLTYTFTMREGVTFHNGDPVTVDDLIESWKMITNPDFAAWNTQGWDKITDITASEDGTQAIVTTSEVFAPFISYVGGGNPILPSSEMAKGVDSFKQQFGQAPIGSGPMKFVEWIPKQQVTLEANKEYWGGAPKLDGIVYRVVPDDNTLLVQLQTGEVQLVGSAGALGAQRVDEGLAIEGLNVLQHATQSWNHLDLKQVDHLRMTKVRQALDFATPKQQIIDQLLKGRALPCVADQAPGTWAYNPDLQPRPYDPDAAKALLAEAGLTQNADGIWEGPTPTPEKDIDPNTDLGGPVKELAIELWGIAGDSTSNQVIQIIAESWKQIGIKTEAKFEDVSTLWGPEGYQWNETQTACLYSWFNGNDPDDMFYWHTKFIPDSPTGTGGNALAYFFPYNFQAKIDELTAAGAVEVDQEKRKEIYHEVQALLADEVPCTFLYWGVAFPAAQSNIGGFWPSAFTNLLWNVEQWYLTEA